MEKRSSSVPDNEINGEAQASGSAEEIGDSDVQSSQASPRADETARLEAALAAERDKHLRLAAEFDNYRKRAVKERQDAGGNAQADLVRGLVEILDDIGRFAHLDPAAVDSTTVVQGVEMVERKIMKTLAGHGLELVDPMGRPFDPAFHEAVGTEPAGSEAEDHLVARVYQLGYVFRGQLIRPARVVVKQWIG